MNTQEAWQADIGLRLDGLRIDQSDPEGDTASVVAMIQRYGFALVTGLFGDGGRGEVAARLSQFASKLGTIVPQSPRGEMVEDVRDYSDTEAKSERSYRARGELSPHTDPTTLILLHCFHPAKSGGETQLTNIRAVHDRMMERNRAITEELYGEFQQWRLAGQYGETTAGPDSITRPVFAMQDGRLSSLIYRPFLELAAYGCGAPLTPRQVAALDLFEECASADDLVLRFHLKAGETLLMHNRSVLHARTDFEDWPEPSRRRHLLRIWIDAPERFPVSPCHELANLFAAR